MIHLLFATSYWKCLLCSLMKATLSNTCSAQVQLVAKGTNRWWARNICLPTHLNPITHISCSGVLQTVIVELERRSQLLVLPCLPEPWNDQQEHLRQKHRALRWQVQLRSQSENQQRSDRKVTSIGVQRLVLNVCTAKCCDLIGNKVIQFLSSLL